MHMHGLRANPPEQNNHRPPRIYLAARRAELRLPTVLAVALISIRCVSRAYAKFVLCLPLPLPFTPPQGAFGGRLFGWGPENCVSGAYARHMVYIREAGDGEDERERGGGSGPACHKVSICQASSEQGFTFRFRPDRVAAGG